MAPLVTKIQQVTNMRVSYALVQAPLAPIVFRHKVSKRTKVAPFIVKRMHGGV